MVQENTENLKMKTIQINNGHYQECDVVMLPTDKKSDMFICNDILSYTNKHQNILAGVKKYPVAYQHLYILSNDEIKKGDWILYTNPNTKRTFIKKCSSVTSTYFDYERQTLEIREIPIKWARKIIATTDSSLRLNSVKVSTSSDFTLGQISKNMPYLPQIPQSFIEKYITEHNKGNVISKVLVQLENDYEEPQGDYFRIKLNQNNEIEVQSQLNRNVEVDFMSPFELPKALPDDVFYKSLDDVDKKQAILDKISIQILKELYQMGFNDGWNEMGNTEYSHDSEVRGFDKVIEELYQKYCS